VEGAPNNDYNNKADAPRCYTEDSTYSRRHTISEILILARRIAQQVRRPIQAAHLFRQDSYKTILAFLVAAGLPEDGTAESTLQNILRLGDGAGDRVVRDQLLAARVVAVAGLGDVVVHLLGAGARQVAIQPDARLEAALADAVVGLTEAAGGFKGAAVERHAEDDFARGDAPRNVIAHSLFSTKLSALRVGGVGVDVGLVA